MSQLNDIIIDGTAKFKVVKIATSNDISNLQNQIDSAENATNAEKLKTARNIDGVSFNGTADIIHYDTCSTAATTAAKTVNVTGFALKTGASVKVKFTTTNTAANPTLNVNNTGAKPIYYRGTAISTGYLAANRTYEFVYNGNQFELVGDLNTDTNNATAQNISTVNNTYPILLGATANATSNIGDKATIFGKGVKVNPSTSEVIATKFTGTFVGNVTGNVSGSSGSCTGNAATATRAIYDENGVRISTSYAPQAQIDYLANVATNSVSAAVSAKNDAVAAKDQAQQIADGLVSIKDTAVDTSLTISGQAADSKTVGDKLNVIGATQIDNDEYLCVWVDSENRVLFGVKKDGSVDWQKGLPKHIVDAINKSITDVTDNTLTEEGKLAEASTTGDWLKTLGSPIENSEYLYVMLDSEGHVLFGVKRDGTVDWQKGTPKHVIEACNPTIENDEYLYLIKDAEEHVLFAIKKDGSINWQKGVPKPVQEKIFTDKIDSEEFVQLTQDSKGRLIEGVLKTGTKKIFSDVLFLADVSFAPSTIQKLADNIAAINPSLFKYENYIKNFVGSRFYVGLDVLYLDGDTTRMTKENKVNLSYRYLGHSGTCTCKWQGASSVSFPKKNYTIAKLKPAIDVGWGTQNKYVLKADFSDASRARNVVSAKLWGGVVKSRTPVNERLSALPNGGAIDGFPIMLVINGEYQGIYNFNIPKDGWMLGMGESSTEAIFNSEGGDFKSTVTKEEVLNAQKWEIAYLPDEDNPDWAIDSLNYMLQATIDSTGANYRDTLEDYLDIESAIDYFIYCALLDNSDGVTKNFLLGTYDGMKWFFVVYDLDWTFGSHSWGTAYLSPQTVNSFATLQGRNRAFHLIYRYDKEALKARYAELRNGALSENSVLTTLSGYLAKIPKSLIDEDYRLWPTTPGTLVNNFDQIMQWYRLRVQYMDSEISNL